MAELPTRTRVTLTRGAQSNGVASSSTAPEAVGQTHGDLRGIVCISSIDWDFIWQGHQEIMATLARQGHRVLFLENTGVRSPTFRDVPRVRQRLRNWLKGTYGFRREMENLYVYSPLVLPFPYSRVARWLNLRLILPSLQRWMRAAGFDRPILWTFLPTPLAHDIIRELDPAVTVYYCIDDLAASSPGARRIASSEIRLFQEADLVFVTSERLRQRAAAHSSRVHLFPFGVNFRQFETVRMAELPPPEDLRDIPRPIVGYIGGLHKWVDQELLAQAAARLPQMSFVLVGPWQSDVQRLAAEPNVHLLGPRSHALLPGYVKAFDVGIVPYVHSEYTANVYPTKLNEYLSMGIPVVATALPEIRRFNAEHGDVVQTASSAEEFAEAIERALADGASTEVAERIDVARTNSWESRIAAMSRLIDTALDARRLTEVTWEESVRRLFRGFYRQVAWLLLLVLLPYVLLFQTPLLWTAAEPLRIVDEPRASDAIVVFAGGVGEDGKSGQGYQERTKQAIDLYLHGQARHIVFQSGYQFEIREADVMRDIAVANGVPPDAITVESNVGSTVQHVRLAHALARREGWDSVLLVSSPYHMRRAVMTWHKEAPDVRVLATPPESSAYYFHGVDNPPSLVQVWGIATEYAALTSYWLNGSI